MFDTHGVEPCVSWISRQWRHHMTTTTALALGLFLFTFAAGIARGST